MLVQVQISALILLYEQSIFSGENSWTVVRVSAKTFQLRAGLALIRSQTLS